MGQFSEINDRENQKRVTLLVEKDRSATIALVDLQYNATNILPNEPKPVSTILGFMVQEKISGHKIATLYNCMCMGNPALLWAVLETRRRGAINAEGLGRMIYNGNRQLPGRCYSWLKGKLGDAFDPKDLRSTYPYNKAPGCGALYREH